MMLSHRPSASIPCIRTLHALRPQISRMWRSISYQNIPMHEATDGMQLRRPAGREPFPHELGALRSSSLRKPDLNHAGNKIPLIGKCRELLPAPQLLCSAMSSMHRCCTSELKWRRLSRDKIGRDCQSLRLKKRHLFHVAAYVLLCASSVARRHFEITARHDTRRATRSCNSHQVPQPDQPTRRAIFTRIA